MYAKIFRQIYEGTLADNWQALVTFQQLLILSDADGVVDMTPNAIHRVTGIPLDIITAGLEVLAAADQGSRTPAMEGRRIVRIDESRNWGWRIVNKQLYRDLTSREEKKESDRLRIAAKRAEEKKANEIKHVADCRGMSQKVADVAHTDTDTDTKKEQEHSSFSNDPKPEKEPVTTLANRSAQVTRDAIESFNASPLVKSNGGLLANVSPTVGHAKRQTQVMRCTRTARDICAESYGGPRITRPFWDDYWAEIAKDPFMSGRQGGGKDHPNWLPDFDYLTREATMLRVYDKAAAA